MPSQQIPDHRLRCPAPPLRHREGPRTFESDPGDLNRCRRCGWTRWNHRTIAEDKPPDGPPVTTEGDAPAWLTVNADGTVEADMAGCSAAEVDRRLIIMQLWRDGWRPGREPEPPDQGTEHPDALAAGGIVWDPVGLCYRAPNGERVELTVKPDDQSFCDAKPSPGSTIHCSRVKGHLGQHRSGTWSWPQQVDEPGLPEPQPQPEHGVPVWISIDGNRDEGNDEAPVTAVDAIIGQLDRPPGPETGGRALDRVTKITITLPLDAEGKIELGVEQVNGPATVRATLYGLRAWGCALIPEGVPRHHGGEAARKLLRGDALLVDRERDRA